MKDICKYAGRICRHSLFRGMEEDEVLYLVKLLGGSIYEFESGAQLDELMQTRFSNSIGCFLSGWARIYSCDPWGKQAILDFVMPNYLLGCYNVFAQVRLPELQTVITRPSSVLFLDGDLLRSPPPQAGAELINRLQQNIAAILSERSWRLLKKAVILSAGSLREKILSYLGYEAVYFGSLSFDIPFDRQGFADYLYVDRSALSRELGRMRRDGLIDFSRSHFQLKLPEDMLESFPGLNGGGEAPANG